MTEEAGHTAVAPEATRMVRRSFVRVVATMWVRNDDGARRGPSRMREKT